MILARMITLEELEKLEEFFKGRTPNIFVPVSETTRAKTPDIKYDKQYAQEHPEELPILEENVIELQKSHAYFMASSTIEEAINSIIICAHQPQSEDAAEGKNISKASYFARGAVALCVYEVPDEIYELWDKQALIKTNEKNENYVNLYGDQTQLDEAIVGNIVFPELFKYLRTFGPYAEVCASLGFTPNEYDPKGVFSESNIDSKYFTVHHIKNQNQESNQTNFNDWITAKHKKPQTAPESETQISCPYKDPELREAFIAITEAPISQKDKDNLYKFLEQARTCDASDKEIILLGIHSTLNDNNFSM